MKATREISREQAQLDLQACLKKPDFLFVSGSNLYGCARPPNPETGYPGSDEDLRGFVIPPLPYLLGIYSFEQWEPADCDTKVYSLKKFMSLLANGCPQTIESLFVPASMVKHMSYHASVLFSNKHLFLSKTIYKRLVGYSYSEFRKAMCEKIEYEKLPLAHDNLRMQLVDFCRSKNGSKEDIDEVVERFDSFRDSKVVSSVSNLGAKRKADYDRYGFCTSSAAHSIRLLGQLDELLLTGNITFPRYNADFLKDIRNGKVSKEDCQAAYTAMLAACDESVKKTKLPEKANMERIDQLYYNLVMNHLAY